MIRNRYLALMVIGCFSLLLFASIASASDRNYSLVSEYLGSNRIVHKVQSGNPYTPTNPSLYNSSAGSIWERSPGTPDMRFSIAGAGSPSQGSQDGDYNINKYVAQTVTLDLLNSRATSTTLRLYRIGALNANMQVYITPVNSSNDPDFSRIIYNGTFDPTSITLAGDGANYAIPLEALDSSSHVSLVSPINNLAHLDSEVIFNASTEIFNGNLTNSTISVWYNNGSLANITTNSLNGEDVINYSTWNISLETNKNYIWSVESCSTNKTSSTSCSISGSNETFFIGLGNIGQNQTTAIYETDIGYYNITFNVSSGTPTANLWFNGTKRTATGTNIFGNTWRFISNTNIGVAPTDESIGIKNLIWEIISGALRFNTTVVTQNLDPINLTICGPSPHNIPYINFTFKNETVDQENINASITSSTWNYYLQSSSRNKSLSYSNSTEWNGFNFCFTPAHKGVSTDISLSYDNGYSDQRTYTPSTQSLTNSSVLKTLFLLPQSDAILVTFQVLNPAEQAISGAQLTLSRSGFGEVATAQTGDSGTATIPLNPNFVYTLQVTAGGFPSFTASQAFSTNEFTVILGASGAANNTDFYRGINWVIEPRASSLINNTDYNFNATLNSTFHTVSEFGFTLGNGSDIFSTQTATTNGGILNVDLTTGTNKSIVMNYFWVINGSYNNVTRTWAVTDLDGQQFSLWRFFSDLSIFANQGIFGLNSFAVSMIAFLIIFGVVGVGSLMFGITSPSIVMFLTLGVTWFVDMAIDLVDPNNFLTGIVAVIAIAVGAWEVSSR